MKRLAARIIFNLPSALLIRIVSQVKPTRAIMIAGIVLAGCGKSDNGYSAAFSTAYDATAAIRIDVDSESSADKAIQDIATARAALKRAGATAGNDPAVRESMRHLANAIDAYALAYSDKTAGQSVTEFVRTGSDEIDKAKAAFDAGK